MNGTSIPVAEKLTLCAMVCLAAFTIDVSIPAIPMIKEYYGFGDGMAQFIVGSYLLGFTCGQIPVGILSDTFGRIPVLISGLILFLVFSIICFNAESGLVLLLSRFMQGVAGAVGPVLARTIARDMSDGVELAKLISLLVSALAVTTLIAPVFGGFLVELYGWQAPFAASVVLAGFVLVLTLMNLSETKKSFIEGANFKKGFTVFFQSKPSLFSGLLVGTLFFGYMAFVSTFTTVLVEVYAVQVQYLGLVFALPIAAYLLGSWIFRNIVSSLGVQNVMKFVIINFLILLVTLPIIIIFNNINLYLVCALLAPFFMAMGLLIPAAMMVAMEPMADFAGTASSILGTIQILFGSLGSLLSAVFYSGDIQSLTVIMLSSVLLSILIYMQFFKGYIAEKV